MIKKLAGNLNMETEIPIKSVISFWYSWKTDCHAILNMDGYMDQSIKWYGSQSYNSQIRLWLDNNGEMQTIFFGNVVHLEIRMEGNLQYVSLKLMSATCLLNREIASASFQHIEKTYGEVAREAASSEGGQVIRNRDADKVTGVPVIRYEETVWQFAGRLAGWSGTCIIPDVVTGRPNFWFGMRKGKEVLPLSEEEYIIDLIPVGKNRRIRYQTEGRLPYSIGDTMIYLKQKLTIIEMEGCYKQGELTFKYVMEDMSIRHANRHNDTHTAGLGLWGTIQEVKGESVKIALDIDEGRDTGEYFYPWQPETGNALYAMPELGAKALLYFYHADQKEGAVIHCLNKENEISLVYKNRSMDIKDGNEIHLWKDEVGVAKGTKHNITIGDSSISARTKKRMELSAGGSIFLRGRRVIINTPEELNISQA